MFLLDMQGMETNMCAMFPLTLMLWKIGHPESPNSRPAHQWAMFYFIGIVIGTDQKQTLAAWMPAWGLHRIHIYQPGLYRHTVNPLLYAFHM